MRVKVITQNGGVKVVDADTGEPVHGVTSVVAFANAKNPIPTAMLELMCVEIDAEADAKFEIVHPVTGLKQAVKRIEFDDGTVLDLP